MFKILDVILIVCYNKIMRIIAGKYKGKKLAEFELGSTRPTADMVREALFDKIGFYVEDGVFLDLFAGTGAVGLEAASRGAEAVYFVDKSKEAVSLIKKNISVISSNNLQVYNSDFGIALEQFCEQNLEFDIIFLDPPYATDFAEAAIEKIKELKLLKSDGIIVWEHDILKNKFIEHNFKNCETKKYGKKFLTYIKLN